jgi:hypothetical protein
MIMEKANDSRPAQIVQVIDPAKLNIQGTLRRDLPEFFKLLDNNGLDWTTVHECFANRGNQYHQRHRTTGKTFQIEASIYNVITESLRGEADALRMLGFMKELFINLASKTTLEEKTFLTPALFGLLTNIDAKYRNFLGELAIINRLKNEWPVTILQTERPLILSEPEGPKIDFHLVNRDTQKEWLIEVVNFTMKESNTVSDQKIRTFLKRKINHKLRDTGIKKSKAFILTPVVWGNWDKIKILADYYQRFNPKFENTIIPSTFVPFSDNNGVAVYKFGSLDTIFRNSSVGQFENQSNLGL